MYIIEPMKAVQVTLDEALLEALETNPEVRRDGRSAVLRRAAREYLARQRREAITAQYRKAYARKAGLGEAFRAWEDEGVWPKE
jgi:metal-responsive CopG/Arc/MetJ family transcriptional regulator